MIIHSISRRIFGVRTIWSHVGGSELGPLATKWNLDLKAWYFDIQKFFGFNPHDLASNVYNSRHRWARRLQYLRKSDPALFNAIMIDILEGYTIPLSN